MKKDHCARLLQKCNELLRCKKIWLVIKWLKGDCKKGVEQRWMCGSKQFSFCPADMSGRGCIIISLLSLLVYNSWIASSKEREKCAVYFKNVLKSTSIFYVVFLLVVQFVWPSKKFCLPEVSWLCWRRHKKKARAKLLSFFIFIYK